MKRICLLVIVMTCCVSVTADPGADGLKIDSQIFLVDWQGSGSWPDDAQEASVVAEADSNYDGLLCIYYDETYCPYSKLKIHNLADFSPNQFGLTTCAGVQSDYCYGVVTVHIDMDSVAFNNLDLQFAYCHEFGHALGAGDFGGFSTGCMNVANAIDYHQHHIDEHMQH